MYGRFSGVATRPAGKPDTGREPCRCDAEFFVRHGIMRQAIPTVLPRPAWSLFPGNVATSDLPVSEFHDAHRVRWQAVVCKDKFSDPKVGSTEYASPGAGLSNPGRSFWRPRS